MLSSLGAVYDEITISINGIQLGNPLWESEIKSGQGIALCLGPSHSSLCQKLHNELSIFVQMMEFSSSFLLAKLGDPRKPLLL